MAQFQYKALNAKGEEKTGSINANSEAEAATQLRAQGLYPTQIATQIKETKSAAKKTAGKKVAKGKAGGKVKAKILGMFTRQLATLIESGLPLLRSLTVLGNQEPDPNLRATIVALADSVQSGSTFSESLAQHPRVFDKLYVNMIKAGELGGVIEVVLVRLAEYQEKALKLTQKIKSAMTYPIIVLCIAALVLLILMTFIVPKFRDMFKEMNIELPMISTVVFESSNFLMSSSFFGIPNALLLMGMFALFIYFLNVWGKTEGGRKTLDALILKIPILGDLQKKSAVSRFSRTLGTLVTSGVPILQALNITRETAGNSVVSAAIGKIHEAVKEGESIVTPMQSSTIFPTMVCSMVEVGEETGQLSEMLLRVANVYDDEVDNAVTAFTSILEPLMIVMLAVIVGVIVLAIFLPLIKLITSMGDAA